MKKEPIKTFFAVTGTGLWLASLALTSASPAWGQTSPNPAQISSAPLVADKEIVAGKPPLTETMVTRYTNFIAWIFDLSLTPPQRQKVRAFLVDYWKSADKPQMQGVIGSLELESQSAAVPSYSRPLLREKVFPDILAQVRRQTADRETRWELSLYDAANAPLAPGSPPLTRAVAAACAEMVCFLASEAQGKPVEATPAFKEATTKVLVQSYTRLSAAQQEQFARIPLQWATLQATWPQIPEAERITLRAQWRAEMAPPSPQQTEQTAHGTAPLPNSGYGTVPMMRSMLSSHSSIMRAMRR